MKRICSTFVLICLFAWNSEAQIAKGNYMLGGGLNLNISPKFNSTLNVRGGYLITDKIAIGAGLDFDVRVTTTIRISPAARYYHNILENTYIFGHVGLSPIDIVPFNNRIGLQIYPGVAYFLNEKFAIEGRLSGMGVSGLGAFLLF